MTCAACGGDGQIEVGAYRGDDTTETRECHLCGGRVTIDSRLDQLDHAATRAGVSVAELGKTLTRFESVSGRRHVDKVIVTDAERLQVEQEKAQPVYDAFHGIDIEGTERARQIRENNNAMNALIRAGGPRKRHPWED